MEPENLQQNIIFLIGAARDIIYKKVTEIFRRTNTKVTIEQFTILTILFYENGLSQQEIANRVNRDKTTITRILNNMEKNDLVVRIPDKSDKRINYIHSTHKGKAHQHELASATGGIYMEAIKNFDAESLKQFGGFLNQLIKNLK